MSDLIKREDAIKALMAEAKEQFRLDHSYVYVIGALRNVEDAIRNIPSADRPQGEWIWSPRDTDGTVSGCCSNCSFSHLFIGGHTAQYNYCPSCGARMKGANDEID